MKKKIKELSIEEKNKAFKKLGKLKQRVEIAKDVLLQIESKYLIPRSGFYLDSKNFRNNYDKEQEIKNLLDKDKSCKACGIGSLFVCTVKRFNKLKVGDLCYPEVNQTDIHEYLEKYFSIFELLKIEAAFEKSDGLYLSIDLVKNIKMEKASRFFKTVAGRKLNAKARLQVIMNNIIENNGVFRVTKPYGEK